MYGKWSVGWKGIRSSVVGDAGCSSLSYCPRHVSLDREYLMELLSLPKAMVRKAAEAGVNCFKRRRKCDKTADSDLKRRRA